MSSIVPLQGDSAGRVLLSTAAVSSGGLPLGELLHGAKILGGCIAAAAVIRNW